MVDVLQILQFHPLLELIFIVVEFSDIGCSFLSGSESVHFFLFTVSLYIVSVLKMDIKLLRGGILLISLTLVEVPHFSAYRWPL